MAYEMRSSDWSSDVCSSDLPSGMPTRLVPSAAAAEPVAADSSPPPPQETARRTERAASSPAAPSPGATPPKPDPDPQSEKPAQPAVSDALALRAGPVVEPQLGDPEVKIGRASCGERVCQYV